MRLTPARLTSFDEYQQWRQDHSRQLADQDAIEQSLCPAQPNAFTIGGRCALCATTAKFRSNFDYAIQTSNGRRIPNLREHLICSRCGLKNRLRAALHLFVQEFEPRQSQPIYITEQLGAAYRWLKGRRYRVSGSEYLPNGGPFGTSRRGVRNEDLGALAWPDRSFDFVLSFDVLEHVPFADHCFSEIFRCLRPGGKLLFTAPFALHLPQTLVRAVAQRDGSVTYLMDPEYHGGNMTDASKGTLCFRYFAWDTLPQLRNAGFSDAWVWLFWSRDLGYLGGTQAVIGAKKS
jgi:SAM-dependent methyltransferase